MNISKDKIDQLFSEKLEAFEVKPRAQAWEKLQNKIDKKSKKQAIGWYRFAAAASVAMILFVGGFSYLNDLEKIKTEPKIVSNTPKVTDNERIEKQFYSNSNTEKTDLFPEKQLTQTQKITTKKLFDRGLVKQQPAQELLADNKSKEIVKPLIETTNIEQKVEVFTENIPTKEVELKEETIQKEEDLTIIFTLANFEKPTINETIVNENINKEKKSKYLTKLYKQLINAKNGDRVDWNEVGFKPAKVFARAENKLKLTKNEINDSYQTAKNKTVF